MLRRKTRALAGSQHPMINPSRPKCVSEYPRMNAGFGTARVAKFDDMQMVAVKEMRLSGDDDDQAQFVIVRSLPEHLQP
jgi:hypothetical protein